jgi:Sulfotransferase family
VPRHTYEPRALPALVRGYNAAGRAFEHLGLFDHRFDEARVLDAARRRARLDDFGADDFREPLRVLLAAFERDAGLSAFGRRTMHAHLVASLAKRLRIEQAIGEHPEILGERIERPLFIVGMPRTGSTHLHHLLASDEIVRAPLYWQLLEPTPPPDARHRHDDPRIERARRALRRGALALPELSVLHAYDAEGPEECQFLFDPCCMNPLLPAGLDYERWWRAQDLEPTYRYYQKELQLLQWRWPGHHWVLKAPFHLWHLEALTSVFPDACFAFTHRDPAEVVPSASSYAAVRSRAYLQEVDARALGRAITESLAALMETGLFARNKLGEERFIDVPYREILRDPMGVVERIHRRFDYPLSDGAKRAMHRYLDAHPQHARGTHRYTLAQFGLDADAIRARFSAYSSRFSAESA